MASLPVPFRRRRSKPAQALETIVKAWAALNVASAGSKAAKKGTEAYGVAKGAKVAGRPVAKLAAIPVVVAGGAVVFRRLRSKPSGPEPTATNPVAHASTVSPPNGASASPVGPRSAT